MCFTAESHFVRIDSEKRLLPVFIHSLQSPQDYFINAYFGKVR